MTGVIVTTADRCGNWRRNEKLLHLHARQPAHVIIETLDERTRPHLFAASQAHGGNRKGDHTGM